MATDGSKLVRGVASAHRHRTICAANYESFLQILRTSHIKLVWAMPLHPSLEVSLRI